MKFTLFADDTSMYHSHQNLTTLIDEVNNENKKITQWSQLKKIICFISSIINIIANLQHHSMTRLLYIIMGGSCNKPLVSRESPELLNQIIFDCTCNNIVNE